MEARLFQPAAFQSDERSSRCSLHASVGIVVFDGENTSNSSFHRKEMLQTKMKDRQPTPTMRGVISNQCRNIPPPIPARMTSRKPFVPSRPTVATSCANPDRMPKRHLRILREVAQIEFQFCSGEAAALKHESKLIRSLKPRFNLAKKNQIHRLANYAGEFGISILHSQDRRDRPEIVREEKNAAPRTAVQNYQTG